MRQALVILAIAALIATTGLAIKAMEPDAIIAPSTVTVTVQTTDGASFKLNGRVILSDTAMPDTVVVEIWKNGTKTIHWCVAVPDSDAVVLARTSGRGLAK